MHYNVLIKNNQFKTVLFTALIHTTGSQKQRPNIGYPHFKAKLSCWKSLSDIMTLKTVT